MLLVKAGPSLPAMIVAENPSLWRSFSRFRRVSVQLTGMRRSSSPALWQIGGRLALYKVRDQGPASRRALGRHQSFVNRVKRNVPRTVSRDMTHHDDLKLAA